MSGEQRVTDERLAELEKIARQATPGPWCIESCGEKGDGSNMIGVAFGPKDMNAEHPLSGWLEACDDEGNFIEYYQDELVAECEHRNRNSGSDAWHIATFNPVTVLELIGEVLAERTAHRATEAKLTAALAEVERFRRLYFDMQAAFESTTPTIMAAESTLAATKAKLEAAEKAATHLCDTIANTELHGDDHHDGDCPICEAHEAMRALLTTKEAPDER